MLRLEKMEVNGFKSFGDRTEIRFPTGITAIVGPNGCGKSNIGDAINWVLGEQSAKMLRGHSMADVIFSGSKVRKPLGMAEVSLVFSGAEALPQADQGRIVVTRRLFRSGESEYRLNGSRARLKDIQEMLRQARVGARTYATIEQGKIDQVLNAKPRERRALIEDAAGIAGYKHKRRLAELKLEATHANLLRVNDIVTEVQRQINSLKRQAAKARRYRRLRDELRRIELIRFARQAREMESVLERQRQEERSAVDAEAEATARLGRLEASLIERRESLEQANRSLREASEQLHRLDIEIDREEGQTRSCRERIDEATDRAGGQESEARELYARHQEMLHTVRVQREALEACQDELERISREHSRQQEALAQAEQSQQQLGEEVEGLRARQFEEMTRLADLRNRARSTEEALQRSAHRRSRWEAEQTEALAERSGIEAEARDLAREVEEHRRQVAERRIESDREEVGLVASRERNAADLEALSEARERQQSALSRQATLEDVETRFAGVSDGVKSLLVAGEAAGIRMRGVVADYVEASREVEGAAEGYLHALLPTVILDDETDAHRAVEHLRAQGAGRTWLICKTQPAGALAVGTPANGREQPPREILEDRRVLGRLRDKLKLKSSANGVVADRIGDAVLVKSLEAALELHRRYPAADYLTPSGETVYASGVIATGGRTNGDQGLLAHKRRMEEARAEALAAAADAARHLDAVTEGREDVQRREHETKERREQLEQAERHAMELQLREHRVTEERERADRRSEILHHEAEALGVETVALEDELGQLRGRAGRAEEEQRELTRTLEECGARVESNTVKLKGLGTEVTELRASQAASRERLESAEAEVRRMDEAATELETRVERIRGHAAAALALVESTTELLSRTERELLEHLGQRKHEAAALAEIEREIVGLQEALARDESDESSMKAVVESLRERTREAEVARTRAEADRAHLDDLCRQELGMEVSEAVGREAEGVGGDVDFEALEAEVMEIKGKIERLGPVNMTAIDEFSDLEERHTFLTSQREDLQRSMESLRESIRRINRESRQRFTEAFEEIRKSYQEIFQMLFSGGRADLRLDEEEDALEAGIDILAQPPGKRLTGVHLLSGGEKALSAIALLFAIFRYQTSPFCLLDEVDAALDDANVGRFARMVAEYAKNTQFIVITHNKLSMEVADLLYGVTMEEPGISKLIALELE